MRIAKRVHSASEHNKHGLIVGRIEPIIYFQKCLLTVKLQRGFATDRLPDKQRSPPVIGLNRVLAIAESDLPGS